ncbi:hypothetical protein B0H63DRAFT_159952 [Podospora didyma]|uniref:Uncharacterized protein n=1 Tax=Podospora didyma TaxID=330526 RepID=A0AAE0U1X2_9PEZI|nr:hypothetical protein B0H63DRAFT_159952 [Podospora didyma]
MAVFCCCTAPRSSKAWSSLHKAHPVLPTPPPPVRLPGPLTLNPVSPNTSPESLSSLRVSVPASIAPIEPVELGMLVVDDSESEEEVDPSVPGKNSSTLQLVRTRIRRHLSQDSLSRRKARSAIGCSQEEIDRRAELKRLMHKRIQEELRNEGGQDTTQSEVSSSNRPRGTSIDNLPGGGPRDNLEFFVSEDDSNLGKQCVTNAGSTNNSQGKNLLPSFSADDSPARRTSCPESHPQSVIQALVRERSSLPLMPASPNLRPRRLPSTHDTSSLGSWRLSYSGSQLDEFLGYSGNGDSSNETGSVHKLQASPKKLPIPGHSHSLSRSHSSPARHGTPRKETSPAIDQSPLSTWLRSQGLRSRSQSPSISCLRTSEQGLEQEGSVKEAEVVYIRRWSSVQNCAVTESDITRPEVVHLYDMDIHRQLVTQALTTPVDSRNHSVGSHSHPVDSRSHPGSERHSSLKSSGSRRSSSSAKVGAPKAEYQKTTSGLGGEYVEVGAGSQIADARTTNSSSVYPSTMNSPSPSPGTCSPLLPDQSARRRVSSLGFQWLDNSGNPHLSNRSQMTIEESPSSGPVCTQGKTDCHLPLSETPGKTRRAPPPEISEKSLGLFHLGHGAPAIIAGRFRKDANPPSTPSPDSTKPSLLARLHLTIPRRARLAPRGFDGSSPSSEEHHIMSPISKTGLVVSTPTRSRSRGYETDRLSPYSQDPSGLSECEDSTAELWQRAVREEAKARKESSTRHSGHRSRRLSFPEDTYKKHKDGESALSLYGSYVHASSKFPDAWPRCPDAWAKFPLYSREERNGPAGCADEVAPKDFARRSVVSCKGMPEYSSEPSALPAEQTPKYGTQSIPGRFSRAVKSGFSKLVPPRSSPSRESPKSTRSHRKGGEKNKGNLEYPEFELLPKEGGYQELKALEHEIQHLKGTPQLRCPIPLQDIPSDRTKVTLSAKMATILHTDGASETVQEKVSAQLLLTPATPVSVIKHRRESTTTTDKFATPLSSMSINNDSSSYHSYPQSRPRSRAMATSSEVVAGTDCDIVSVKSDTTPMQIRPATAFGPGSEFGVPGSKFWVDTSKTGKCNTWSGRSKTHPPSTLEGVERID